MNCTAPIRSALSRRGRGAERVILASLTFAECLVGPAKLGALDEAPLRWVARRADSGLRLPEVVVLDTALHHGAEGIATFDDRLAGIAIDRGLHTFDG